MWFDSWYDVGRVVLSGVVVYGFLVALLRTSGKRTLAQLNAFDLVVTVALGSVLATVIVSRDVSWLEAAAALGVLVLGQFVVAWVSVRSARARTTIQARPALLVGDGGVDEELATANRITIVDIAQAVRAAGYGSLDLVGAVVLETDGSLSVIPSDQLGRGELVDLGPTSRRPPHGSAINDESRDPDRAAVAGELRVEAAGRGAQHGTPD